MAASLGLGLPEEAFEGHIAEAKEAGREITTEGLPMLAIGAGGCTKRRRPTPLQGGPSVSER